MDKKFSIKKKEPAEIQVTSEFNGNSLNCSRKLERQRSLSGPGSEGEKSFLKKNPRWLISSKAKAPVFNSCLCSLDEVVATPSFNVSVIESACDHDFKFFDAINNSKYVGFIDGALGSLGLFAAAVGIYVVKYCELREIERNSNYFYFSRLFNAGNEEDIKNKMGKIQHDNYDSDEPITYNHLLAAAYFYPPDISKIACWRRRFFAFGSARKQLNELNKFLQKNSKEKTLNKLHKEITEKVCQLLNSDARSKKFKKIFYKNKWIIALTDSYSANFFGHVQSLIDEHAEMTLKNNSDKKNKKFIPAILAALGQASFIYWILIFIFYFIPIAPVVTAALISVIPLAIALCGALPLLLIFRITNVQQACNANRNMTVTDIKEQKKHMLGKKIVGLNKKNKFYECLQYKENISTVDLKNSPLMADLKAVLKKRRFSKYHAIGMGFIEGCFLPLFTGWLLLDGTKVILTYALCPAVIPLTSFTPIGPIATAIIAGVTLFIGISYGIYSAYKANQVHEAKFDDLQVKVKALEDEVPTKQVLNKRLLDYEHTHRRFSNKLHFWTYAKKTLNRFMIIIKRLGTGSLVFRLVIWGPITAIVAASTAVMPTFFPLILIIGTAIGAFIIASWYLYAYNVESKTTQAGRIVEHLVQSEQLSWIDTQLPVPLTEECLNIHESSSQDVKVVAVKIVKCENDAPTQQNGLCVTANTAEVDAMTTKIEPSLQRSNSNSSVKGGLFKIIQNREDKNTSKDSNENLKGCLSIAAIPSY
ncbi:MAG: hypothetical protein WAL30_07295 [Candidatus Aquirickettsiella sp.]